MIRIAALTSNFSPFRPFRASTGRGLVAAPLNKGRYVSEALWVARLTDQEYTQWYIQKYG
ncbi:hypothetical protein PS2015_232 [Pseudohongiella spirulinae]|uniref:Uncharacterized protein n=1 Tax=Pseudohongiella spirulinae TaxID=1249552 RepID=A0A0S2K9D7_9GAMM|nr:hypothetical protein PS2015_232 [Pseudohongiella spirulinae]